MSIITQLFNLAKRLVPGRRPTLYEALDRSLANGYSSVRWQAVQWSVVR